MNILKSIIATLILTYSITSVSAATIEKIGAGDIVNEKVAYAFQISGGNTKFIGTIDSENSQWTNTRRSNTGYRRNGKMYYDWGACQISEYYHPKITNNVLFWTDWKWQMDRCWDLYKGGTKFYGSKNAGRAIKNFKISY